MEQLEQIVHVEDIDYCEFVNSSKKHPVPIVNMFKNILTLNQTIPKCPIIEGASVDILRTNFDSNWFPMIPFTKCTLFAFFNVNGFKKSVTFNISAEISNRRRRVFG